MPQYILQRRILQYSGLKNCQAFKLSSWASNNFLKKNPWCMCNMLANQGMLIEYISVWNETRTKFPKSLLNSFSLCPLSINFEFLIFIPSSLLAVMVMMHSTILAPCLRRRIKTKRRFTTLSSTAGYDPTVPYPLTDNRFAVNGVHSHQPRNENTASRRSTTRKRTTWSRCEFSSTNSRSPWPII